MKPKQIIISPKEKTAAAEREMEEEKARFADIWSGSVSVSAVPDDELREMIKVRARLFGIAEDCYDLSLYNHVQLLRILKSSGFGGLIETVLEERNQDSYSVQVSSDPVTIAQYAYEPVMSTHMVTVVGWDDTFAAFGNTGCNADVAYDNLPVKAYIYPLDEVEKAHDLSERIPTSGGEAAICPEDGYLLLDIAR